MKAKSVTLYRSGLSWIDVGIECCTGSTQSSMLSQQDFSVRTAEHCYETVQPKTHRYSAECTPTSQNARLKAGECSSERKDQEVFTALSLLGDSKGESVSLKVGRNAHDYLEDCFNAEASVLDRDKFNAIPELSKSDLTILGRLGKGTYSDVFNVLCTSRASRDKSRNTAHCSPLSKPCFDELEDSTSNSSMYAMKCLRPQIRSDSVTFHTGAEDLVHETAVLANLNHPHIIKLQGRAAGSLVEAFQLNNSYFILLEKLTDTLHDRIDVWKQTQCLIQGPQTNQLEVAHAIADAMAYLHSKNIVFRDLKPENVGFHRNTVKLFDFGFAIANSSGFLYDKCGTPRYMAPEVGLTLGYGIESDVYSFGVLLWEMSALEKPFSTISSMDVFHRTVFVGGKRPALGAFWAENTKKLMRSCWSSRPGDRPTMLDLKSSLSLAIGATKNEHQHAL